MVRKREEDSMERVDCGGSARTYGARQEQSSFVLRSTATKYYEAQRKVPFNNQR